MTILTRQQCRMARAALGLSVRELAKLADVSPNTITRLERGEVLHRRTARVIRSVLENQGIEFIAEAEQGLAVRVPKADQMIVGK